MVSDTKILETWETWGCGLKSQPIMVEELSGGQTNRSFLLDANGRKLVMRVNAPAERFPGIDRAREARIWRAASDARLAPSLIFVDPEERFVITEYINGRTLDPSRIDGSSIDHLLTLLADVHNLDIDTPALDYALYISVYWEMIESRTGIPNSDLKQHREPMEALVNVFIESEPRTGLCHHDPVASNVIQTGERLYMLDWEYATRGFVAMDYATLAIDWGIEDAVIMEHTDIDPTELHMAKHLYRHICSLWKEFA